jgi:hypothetical protein
MPNIGDEASVFFRELTVVKGVMTEVTNIHSHGQYLPNYDNNRYSPADKKIYCRKKYPGYVATPNGHLQRWDPKARGGWWRGKATTLAKYLFRDPNHK